MLHSAVELAEKDPEEFVRKAKDTKSMLGQVAREGGKRADAAYKRLRKPGALRNEVIRAGARELRRRGL